MGFQDVAFLPSQAGFYTHFLNITVRTTTCLRTVVGGKEGHAPCKGLLFHQKTDHKTSVLQR